MKYRYYINDVEVFPKGEWSIEYQRNEGQIFFRRIFEGELTFDGDDYDFITGLDCEIATFDVYCGGTVFWQGQFQYPYLLGFDDDSCVVVLTPEVVDEYSCIMNNYETEYIYLLTIGGINPELWSCPAPGINLHNFPLAYPLGVPGAGSTSTGHLNRMINLTVGGMNCGVDLRSSFLWRDDFANGDNFAAAYGTDNYITGAGNRLEFVYLMTNTSLRNSFGGTLCGGVQYVTFKMYEDLLRNAFNAYWFIDENGDFRIEHHYYFDPAFPNSDYVVGHDLNTVMDRGGRSFAYRRNKYEYETGRMYDQEVWTWQHYEGTEALQAHGTDFEGVPIFYGGGINEKSVLVPGVFKEKEYASPQFWTDIDWAYNAWATFGSTDFLDCPGFCIMDVVSDAANNKINCEIGILTGVSQANGHLSTANLQNYYHQYDRIFLAGNMNTGDVTIFQTAQKHKLQEPIEFPLCCDEDFDPLNRIRTGLGDGEVKAAVEKKQSLEVELWHEFDCISLCVPDGCVKWDGIDDRINIAVPSFVAVTGTITVQFEAYLIPTTDVTVFSVISLETADVNDYFALFYAPQQNLFFIRTQQAGGGGDNFTILSSHYNKCVSIEITKTAGTATGMSIDGVALTDAGGGLNATAPTGSYIGYSDHGGAQPYLKNMALWDIRIFDNTLTLIHNWRGYPAGNGDGAWIDQVGPNDGTVVGSPSTY